MKLTHAKNLIRKIIKEQEEKNKSRKLSIGKGTSGKVRDTFKKTIG